MSFMLNWIHENPGKTGMLCALLLGAIGDLGRYLSPNNPVLGRIFGLLSSLGISALGILGLLSSNPSGRLSQMAPPLSGLPSVPPPPSNPAPSLPEEGAESLPPNTLLSGKKDERGASSIAFLLETLASLALTASVSFVLLMNGCSGLTAKEAVKIGSYENELQSCLSKSKTCDEYVTCRKEVSVKYSREFTGSCEDGGVK